MRVPPSLAQLCLGLFHAEKLNNLDIICLLKKLLVWFPQSHVLLENVVGVINYSQSTAFYLACFTIFCFKLPIRTMDTDESECVRQNAPKLGSEVLWESRSFVYCAEREREKRSGACQSPESRFSVTTKGINSFSLQSRASSVRLWKSHRPFVRPTAPSTPTRL